MTNGSMVAEFERAFAEYVGAKYAIALCNGTATLHTALIALGVKPGDRVAVPPLTMSATTIAVLHAGAVPVFCDVNPRTWLLNTEVLDSVIALHSVRAAISVSLYGLHAEAQGWASWIDDAAQTLRKHSGAAFTSYSFQASKILALGEGGMLVTDSEELATRAREFSSLGYRMRADQPRIDPAVLKSPTYERHHSMGYNYRMNDLTATEGLSWLERGATSCALDGRRTERIWAAEYYRNAIADCSWITSQHVPDGWTHDYWAYAVALESADLWHPFVDAVVHHGGERPYAAWRLTYHEPAFRHLAEDGICPVAESLQPRLIQLQTNNLASADRNAAAIAKAIRELGGSP